MFKVIQIPNYNKFFSHQDGGDVGDHGQAGLIMNDEQEIWNNEMFKIWEKIEVELEIPKWCRRV